MTMRVYLRLSDMFRDMERHMRDTARMFEDIERRVFGGRGLLPSIFSRGGWERDLPIETKADGSRMYRARFDMAGFEPENVRVSLKGNMVTIQAKAEGEKSGVKTSRDYCYEFALPDEVNPEVVKSYIDETGVLCIEAELPKLEPPKPKVRDIKIDRGGNSSGK